MTMAKKQVDRKRSQVWHTEGERTVAETPMERIFKNKLSPLKVNIILKLMQPNEGLLISTLYVTDCYYYYNST